MYKLRIYFTSGHNKGNLKKEEIFNTLQEMDGRYKELFKKELFALNPTAWKNNGTEWERITNNGTEWVLVNKH